MTTNLIQELSKVKDFRTKDGQRHPLWFRLLIVIMGTMSGYFGYRALGDFVKRHQSTLIESFAITKERVPSYSTIRRVMMGIDFAEFAAVFNAWAARYACLAEAAEWVAIDGKSISGTLSAHTRMHQNFVSVVSAFSAQRGLVLGLDKLENKHASAAVCRRSTPPANRLEIVTVQALLKALDLEGVVLSLDALHC